MADATTDDLEDDLEEVVDPNALMWNEPVEMTRVFTDPKQPRKKFTLTLRSDADAFFTTRAAKKASAYITDFVTGRPDPNRRGATLPPAPILLTPGRGIVPIEEMLMNIAALQLLQVGGQWDVHRWAALAVKAPVAFSDMMAFSSEVIARACGTWRDEDAQEQNTAEDQDGAKVPNGWGVGTASPSGPPAPDTPPPTLTS